MYSLGCYQEHHVADLLVKELHALAKDNETWGAKFKVLTLEPSTDAGSLEHHVEERRSHAKGVVVSACAVGLGLQ
jgi:hypothetical protein